MHLGSPWVVSPQVVHIESGAFGSDDMGYNRSMIDALYRYFVAYDGGFEINVWYVMNHLLGLCRVSGLVDGRDVVWPWLGDVSLLVDYTTSLPYVICTGPEAMSPSQPE